MKFFLTQYWKIIVGLFAIFIGGLGIGAVLGSLRNRETPSLTYGTSAAPAKDWVEGTLASLDQSLGLTPEQKELVRPHVEAAGREIHLIREGALLKFQLSLLELHRSIPTKSLSDEQKRKLEKSQKILETLIQQRSDDLLDSDPQAELPDS